MAKYSTGGVGSGESGSCELCGAEGRSLSSETVAGAQLEVCSECQSRHGEGGRSGGSRERSGQGNARPQGNDEASRRKRAAQNVARLNDAQKGNPQRWEDGADYEDDPLPYLRRGYGSVAEEARQEAGLQTAELAGELGVTEADVLAVEQGRATSAGIGGTLIRDIEERLNVELVADE